MNELTEFEKRIFVMTAMFTKMFKAKNKEERISFIKEYSATLLDLARKDVENEADNLLFRMFGDVRRYADNDPRLDSVKQGYYLGKRDALKDLPKWKKATEYKKLNKDLCVIHENVLSFQSELSKGDYYIELENLKKLPIEEVML